VKLLAVDAAAGPCTVAVWIDGRACEREAQAQPASERILVLIDEVLAEAGIGLKDLDAIAFGRGPGSFTGLRIAAAVAQGLAFGAELAVVPVSSLAALAQGIEAVQVLAAFDARMQQVYWGAYARDAHGRMVAQGEEIVAAPAAVPIPAAGVWIGAGSGWDVYHEVLRARLGARVSQWCAGAYPRARHVAELGVAGLRAGQALAPEQALPVYIRDEVAKKMTR
jgi:tRNA threonylcarbamoyladenosine biosynthesis protein TsaB